jgi:hypothetical protein
MKKLMLSFVTVALAIASAATHKLTLYQPATISGTELQPGQYRIELKENKAVISSGKTQVEADVKAEQAESKFNKTSVRFANGDGKMKVTEIRLGGTSTRLVFEN